jgi:hypothetical protein
MLPIGLPFKGTTQSYAEAIRAGHFKTKVTNEWKRMTAMDVSDIYYNKPNQRKNESQAAPPLSVDDFGARLRLEIKYD